MKVKEIEYSRLFNFENYNNERISLRVAIDDNEDADAVIGQLFFKVLQIEEALNLYRDYLRLIAGTIEETKKNRDSALSRLKALKTYKERMAELIRAGEFEKVLSSDFFEEADALRDCSKCKHFEDRGADEYSCKYLREGKVVFQSDSTDTAESCPYYEEADA